MRLSNGEAREELEAAIDRRKVKVGTFGKSGDRRGHAVRSPCPGQVGNPAGDNVAVAVDAMAPFSHGVMASWRHLCCHSREHPTATSRTIFHRTGKGQARATGLAWEPYAPHVLSNAGPPERPPTGRRPLKPRRRSSRLAASGDPTTEEETWRAQCGRTPRPEREQSRGKRGDSQPDNLPKMRGSRKMFIHRWGFSWANCVEIPIKSPPLNTLGISEATGLNTFLYTPVPNCVGPAASDTKSGCVGAASSDSVVRWR